MDYLHQQYLLAAYELAKEDPISHTFNEDDIANHVDLDPSEGPRYAERFMTLTQYHLDEGHLARLAVAGWLLNFATRGF